MNPKARDSYLKNPPDSRNFSRRIARIRQKGFHAEDRAGEGNELDAVAVYQINPSGNPIIGARPWGDGTPRFLLDTSAVNTKDITVPAGKAYWIKTAFVHLSTTATVGNRTVRARVFPQGTSGTEGFRSLIFGAHVASSSAYYSLAPGLPFSEVGSTRHGPLPEFILTEGGVLRLEDAANIDAVDALRYNVQIVEFDA